MTMAIEMNIFELMSFVKNGTNAPIEVSWKWEKIHGGNECKTLIVKYKNEVRYWQGHKNKNPEKLRKDIYKKFNIYPKTELQFVER